MASFRVLTATLIAAVGAVIVMATGQAGGVEPRSLGTFHADCDFSHSAADDAIVFPGEPGRSHLHDFFGSRTTNAFSTPESLVATSGTSCHRPDDRSAYWAPTLYAGDSGNPIPPIRASAYYKAGYRDFASIQPFPAGLKMIAGDATARDQQKGRTVDWTCELGKVLDPGRSSDDSPRAQALRAQIAQAEQDVAATRKALARARKSLKRRRAVLRAFRRTFVAGTASRRERRSLARRRHAVARAKKRYRARRGAYQRARQIKTLREQVLNAYLIGGGTSIPTCQPGSHLELIVRFPDCWDGENLDSANHKSHMAYSYQERRGNPKTVCPRSHPVLVPQLDLEIRYHSLGGPDVRLSPGDVDAGHADFMNGWDQGRLAQLVRDCLNVDRYCGGENKPVKNDALPTEPSPDPSPSPDPDPSPSPDPDPSPSPDPDPDPLPPLPGLP